MMKSDLSNSNEKSRGRHYARPRKARSATAFWGSQEVNNHFGGSISQRLGWISPHLN